ncbi:MAG: hypothetical protein QM820_00950 [Minicystis sp.]
MRERWHERPQGGLDGGEQRGESVLAVLLGLFAIQDVILLAGLAALGALAWVAPPGPARADAARVVYLSTAGLAIGCFAGRGLTGMSPAFRATFYRAVLIGVLVSNPFAVRDVIAAFRLDAP